MKKVTVLGPAHPYRGGLASIMEIMARTFTARGAEVDIKTFTLQYPEFLFPGKTQYSDRPAPEDLAIERCVSTVNPFNWIKVGRRICRERPDVVHSMTPKAGLLCMLASMLTRVPVRIHTFTGLVFPTASGWKQKVLMLTDRITCWSATHVIPEGEGVKNDLLKYGITSKPLQVLGYGNIRGIDLNYYRCDETIQGQAQEIRQRYDNDFIFLYVGRILDEKGMRELVTAYKRFDEAHAHSRLLLVGPIDTQGGLDSETSSMILEHPHIEQIGFLPDVRAYYAASNCFVFPSYREGFPNVVIEAGAMSLPCIVTDINGSREIIQHNKTGLVVEVKNETALYEAMEYMYTHPIEAKQMSAQACTWVKEHYEQSYVWNCLETYYKQVIKEQLK